MHISEGVLSGPVLTAGAVIAAAGTGIGLKKLEHEKIVQAAILASAFFVASLIHVNIGPASAHLILNGIVGILLGFAAFPAILTALILQAVLFQYGGITALGVNVIIMAVPAVVAHYALRSLTGRSEKMTFLAGFLAGFFSIALSGILLSGALWLTNAGFLKTCVAILGANVPVMLIEGVITAFCLSFLMKVYPEMLSASSRA